MYAIRSYYEQAALLQAGANHVAEFVRIEGLDQIVACAALEGLDGSLQSGVAGYQDDVGRVFEASCMAQNFQSYNFV